ncbi:MAG: hypothetical protein AB1598_12525 [Thermodesulfobacteriota bacterium]
MYVFIIATSEELPGYGFDALYIVHANVIGILKDVPVSGAALPLSRELTVNKASSMNSTIDSLLLSVAGSITLNICGEQFIELITSTLGQFFEALYIILT